MLHKLNVFLFFSFVFVALSCKKTDSNLSANSTPCYVTTLSTNGIQTVSLSYDYQVSKATNYDSLTGTTTGYTTYAYDGSSKIDKVTYYNTSYLITSYINFIYNSDTTLVSDTTYYIYGSITYKTGYRTYSYNSLKQMTLSVNYMSVGLGSNTFEVVSSEAYTYTSNGNVATEKNYDGSSNLVTTTTYTYDNNPAFASNSDIDPGNPEFENKNNVLSATTVDASGNAVAADSYTITYIYNSDNYPILGEKKYQNGTSQTDVIAYNCD